MEPEELLLNEFFKNHPAEAARLIEAMPLEEEAGLLEETAFESSAAVVGAMAPSTAAACLASMDAERAGSVLAHLPIAIATGLLRRMESGTREAILERLPPQVREPAGLLLHYPEDTAGAWMDPLVHALPREIAAKKAVELLSRRPQDLYFYLYVVDGTHQLVGVLDLRELLWAEPDDTLGSIMHTPVSSLPALAGPQAILTHPGWQELDALPVVDEGGGFLGMIRHRFLRQIEQSLRARSRDQSAWNPLLMLGELYWVGMREFFQYLATNLVPSPEAPDQKPKRKNA